MKFFKRTGLAAAVLALVCFATACEDDSLEDKVDDATDEIEDTVDDAADDLEDAAEELDGK